MAVGKEATEARDGARESGLDPIGQALRATYDAENHDSLGQDLTGLMLQLARVDDPPKAAEPAPVVPVPPASWFRRLLGRTLR